MEELTRPLTLSNLHVASYRESVSRKKQKEQQCRDPKWDAKKGDERAINKVASPEEKMVMVIEWKSQMLCPGVSTPFPKRPD